VKPALARIAVLMAVFIAAVGALAAPAAAGPVDPPLPGNCWNEFGTGKTGSTIHISAFKDCAHLNVPQALTLTLETHVCDEQGGGCYWIPWKSGIGNVSYTCPGTYWAMFRNSRLPAKIVWCDPW
jgi:hypothetical protein